ncbi:MAG: PLP-dependent aminotransferase family protein [Veillonella sp.]|nr:PLP-dependent aminotransferase family protein [Veillonella sp.]
MSFSLPERVTLKGPNFIREVFERGVGVEGFISFGIGNPAPEAIPVEIIEKAFDEVVHSNPMSLLQYGPMQGDARLAELTLERLVKTHKMNPEGQGLIISNGAGQLLGLVPITVLEPGDEVYMDEFTFTSAINSVRSGKGKYIYLIPNFQNPTGITMPLERRKEIYAIASKYDLFIYEDDPYGEIRFAGEYIPTFKSFDTENRVLYAGSYSKTLSAGLRVGFLFGPAKVIETIQALKNNTAGQMPLVTQKVVAKVLDTIDYDAHLENVRKVYKTKCDALLDAFNKYASSKVKLTQPTGGMFAWMTMPEDVDCDEFFETCMNRNVGIIKCGAFAADGAGEGHAFRLSYTVPTVEEITKGMEILGALTKEFCGE